MHVYSYEKKIKDFNFGSLIRMDATKEYSETNTIFGAPVLPVRAFRTLLLTDDVPACDGVRYVGHHSNTNTGEMSYKCAPRMMPDAPDTFTRTSTQFYAIEVRPT